MRTKNVKFIFTLLLIVVLIILQTKFVNASTEAYGDVNGDGKTTSTDILQIKKHIVNLVKLEGEAISKADVNGDGNITTTDLILIKKVIVGLDIEPIDNAEDFDTSFLRFENNDKNIIYSPLSIKYALNMLNEGANGKTKEEIENVIKDLKLTKYENIEKVLSLANATFIRESFKDNVKKEFTESLSEKYNAEVKYDVFDNANNVNAWIEDKTLGIIKDVINDKLVQNPLMKLLLINALAIDMEWNTQFDMNDTYGREFNLANGEKMTATTMHDIASGEDASYYKDDDVTVLTKDLKKYGDVQLEFTAIMPNNGEISEYISKFTTKELDNITNKSVKASQAKDGLSIYIPKFSFDYSLKLKEDLENLGITEVFGENADLSGIKEGELHVSEAIHKADIEFTEKGVKAAAITAFAIVDGFLPGEPKEYVDIIFDKPFVYVIRDKNTGEIWFVGALYEPNNWENDSESYQKPSVY